MENEKSFLINLTKNYILEFNIIHQPKKNVKKKSY